MSLNVAVMTCSGKKKRIAAVWAGPGCCCSSGGVAGAYSVSTDRWVRRPQRRRLFREWRQKQLSGRECP